MENSGLCQGRLEERRKVRARYKIEITLPTDAAKLLADAQRSVRHSPILLRNFKNATSKMKLKDADAHLWKSPIQGASLKSCES